MDDAILTAFTLQEEEGYFSDKATAARDRVWAMLDGLDRTDRADLFIKQVENCLLYRDPTLIVQLLVLGALVLYLRK